MSKVYNKAFKVGFGFNILIFAVLNFISCIVSYNKYTNRTIKFSHDGYSWGFPFEMYRYYLGYPYSEDGFTADGVVMNTFVIIGSGFVLGLLFRFVCSKLSEQKLDLE